MDTVNINDIVYRLRKRAEIRRQIPGRKSVEEGKPDRIADILEEAADEIENAQRIVGAVLDRHVAVDGGHADQFQPRMQRGEHDRDGVVGGCVGVDPDAAVDAHLPTAAAGTCC